MDNLSEITYLGKTDFRNGMTKFGIRAKDRFRHMYIIGKSGTGKTTLLENMIVQDIYNGNGIAFLDPHGESADKILRYIPSNRINDVIYFSPSDSEFPVAFNPMEIADDATASERSLIADGLMTVFKKIWPDAFSGRMEYILNNTMLALLEYPEPSLLSVNRMLTDKDFRKKVIACVTDPTVRNAWDELSKWDDKRWSEAIGALVNKIGQFTTNPIARNIIGQAKSTFNFRDAMDQRKIIIINLSKGLIGEESAKLIGALIITKIYLASMSRANLTPEQLLLVPPLYFYVDEFQNFANDSFANILSEARKYKLALTVANQFVAQMEESIRDAVFGNMGTIISFRVGPFDAEFLERVFTPIFTGEDLQNVGFGQIFLTLLIDGMSSRPFSAATLAPIQPSEPPQREAVIEASRRQYARNRADVEEKIMGWFNEQRRVIKKDDAQKPAPLGGGTQFIVPKSAMPTTAKNPVFDSIPTPSKKEDQVKPSTVVEHEELPVTLSPQIFGLLDQLGESGEADTVEQKKPTLAEPVKPVVKKESVSIAPKSLEKPIKDRAAKAETKNVLLEALQKAQQLKQKEVIEKPTPTKPLNAESLQETLQKALAESSSRPVQNAIAPKPIRVEILDEVTTDKLEETPKSEDTGFEHPKAVREVPEEILKKILD
ncbi:MAG TPA: type IV secretion system DNA-binding domain-containing protein [Candidatus Paceibacterota bacterium]|nr:type IV secretion system DNA-binding domain-containing protein [Candidatus Paceibacterota bacterium]